MMRRTQILAFIFISLLLTACNNNAPAPQPTLAAEASVSSETGAETGTEPIQPEATPTETAVPPTATPSEPLAATVNNRPITLSTYERELARYEQAQSQLGQIPEGNAYRSLVLEALIEKELIVQAAEAAGVTITAQMVDEKLAELEAAAGGAEPFNQWLALNQWTAADFREALTTEMIAGQMRDRVTAETPTTGEQVNARYIQVDDAGLAQTLQQRAAAGDDFAFLARQNSLDQVTAPQGGELGFFARQSLLVPEVEAAAFALQQPGDISDVITVTNPETGQTTYYVVQLIERDMERPLTADLRIGLLQQTFEAWLSALWDQAAIELLIDTSA